ncbi:hypothetical protein [Sulfurospirillum arcachonense]|uniref:hypothetical protein n=1 Tax=Sulfurospirillum arcachonense TaxID=57666 RepID=UPI000469E970|nr:hypothetical protein [Sulfurospirillum arcachonense]
MNYYMEDFTESNYKKILEKNINTTIFYNEIHYNEIFILWRHDIDYSIHRAYTLALIEKKYSIKATYFLQLSSFFYNIFEEEIKELIIRILSLGHQIGLHFDPTQYNIQSKEDLEKYLNFEKKILENLFQVEIKVFSFHNPTKEILKYDDFKYSSMINTYAKYFKENVEYCSDSNGYWRYKRLEDFLNEKHTKIQVLTHPSWWQKEIMSPRDRIQRCIDGRSRNTAKKYDVLLNKYGRENVK